MKTTDFTAKVTSHQLNEAMFKKFGTRINFESYEREELEKYRNLLRTKIHQTESSARFNDLLSNDTYQKDKHMLELLNTRIKEMLGEGAKVDRQAKHITASMMKKGKSKDDAEAIATTPTAIRSPAAETVLTALTAKDASGLTTLAVTAHELALETENAPIQTRVPDAVTTESSTIATAPSDTPRE